MDEDGSKNLTAADEVAATLATPGWHIIKASLDATILDLQNIANIDTSDAVTMQADIRSRMVAVNLLWAWLRKDVYGLIEQQKASQQKVIDSAGDNFIERHLS